MKRTPLSIPEIGLIAGTRAMFGAGLALLLSDRFRSSDQRRAVGWTLLAIGAFTTIPIAIQLIGSQQQDENGDAAATPGPQRYREYVS
jgi:hypothetical protein